MADTFVKDPDEILDYRRDWADELASMGDSDTIATSAWEAEAGITLVLDTNDTTSATVWLSGGTLWTDYEVTNRITTVGGRTHDKTLLIQVRAK